MEAGKGRTCHGRWNPLFLVVEAIKKGHRIKGVRMGNFGGQSEVGPLKRVLLKHPRDSYPPQDLLETQWQELGYHSKPDLAEASDEHDALVELLESLGARVEMAPASSETGLDSLYVRDASVLAEEGMILCNMGKRARWGEPKAQETLFREEGIPVLGRIEGEGTLEGGDFIWLTDSVACVGRGYRTNDEGILQLRNILSECSEEVVEVPLPHWKGPSDVFHLMSVISPIDFNLALVYSPLLPVSFREYLISRGIRLVEVPESEFETMGCNVLTVAPRVCIALEGNPETRARLQGAGAEVFSYSGKQISIPGEGGPTCLTRPVFREI
jgi:N-dimethylarginine dimethylaminohydrolase